VTDARHDDHIKVVDRMWFFSGGAAAIGLLGNYILKKLGLA
jgi:hypothetical protein